MSHHKFKAALTSYWTKQVDRAFGFVATDPAKEICLLHVPALKRSYWSQQEHYKASNLALHLFPSQVHQRYSLSLPPREQDTSLCLFHLCGWSIFPSRNNLYEGAPGVFSVQMPLYTTSKTASESHTTLCPKHTTTTCSETHSLSHWNVFSHRKLVLLYSRRCDPSPDYKNKKRNNLFVHLMLGMDTSLNFYRKLFTIAVLWQWSTKAIV